MNELPNNIFKTKQSIQKMEKKHNAKCVDYEQRMSRDVATVRSWLPISAVPYSAENCEIVMCMYVERIMYVERVGIGGFATDEAPSERPIMFEYKK